MPRSRKNVESALTAKGFVLSEGDHHYFVYYTKSGLKTLARTKTSHSPKVRDIDDSLLSKMARQCLLTKPDFLRLVDCPLSRDGYEAKLVDQGEVVSPERLQVGSNPADQPADQPTTSDGTPPSR